MDIHVGPDCTMCNAEVKQTAGQENMPGMKSMDIQVGPDCTMCNADVKSRAASTSLLIRLSNALLF